MEFANHVILISAALITFSIFAGVLSTRVGAPLLLVFLGFGMLAGVDGPGGIRFFDYELAYLAASLALALILFDGGLRTSRQAFSVALAPALVLATVGVVVTAAVVAVAAHFLLGYDWLSSFLLGAIVGPTDAAAVFMLLHLRGLRLRPRIAETLEVESGLNDPMSIFLTLAIVALLAHAPADIGVAGVALEMVGHFIWQIGGGIVFGLVGGFLVLRAINRLKFSSGIYPILAGALALVVFAAAQSVEASGFMAIYLVGVIVGNNPHRATSEINRFSDGLAWLAQIGMFLMMGLLVSPSMLVPVLVPALVISTVLILAARPIAVFLSLLPFKFGRRETGFISWVGLRGAVPIYLGIIPILERIPNAMEFFDIAFVVVIVSLVVQGWSISRAAQIAKVNLPPRPAPRQRLEFDLPLGVDRSIVAYTVHPMSVMARRRAGPLPTVEGVELLSVMRDGQAASTQPADGFRAGDVVMLIASTSVLPMLDRLFAGRKARSKARDVGPVDFTLGAEVHMNEVAALYGIEVPRRESEMTLAELYDSRFGSEIEEGMRIRLGDVEFVALHVEEGHPRQIGLDLDPPPMKSLMERLRMRLDEAIRAIREIFLAEYKV